MGLGQLLADHRIVQPAGPARQGDPGATSAMVSLAPIMARSLARVCHVNWFRKTAEGKFIWPGFGENMRVLKWIVDRVNGNAKGKETPIGWTPYYEDINWNGLDFPQETFDQLQQVDRKQWKSEVLRHEELFIELHDHLPQELIYERELLIGRL